MNRLLAIGSSTVPASLHMSWFIYYSIFIKTSGEDEITVFMWCNKCTYRYKQQKSQFCAKPNSGKKSCLINIVIVWICFWTWPQDCVCMCMCPCESYMTSLCREGAVKPKLLPAETGDLKMSSRAQQPSYVELNRERPSFTFSPFRSPSVKVTACTHACSLPQAP